MPSPIVATVGNSKGVEEVKATDLKELKQMNKHLTELVVLKK
jgi:hypothetical protein